MIRLAPLSVAGKLTLVALVVAGTVAGLFNLVALFAVGAAERLLQPGGPVAFVGGWIMVVALVVASVAGAIAVWLGDRR
jgi:hypothetical protein